MSLIAAALAVSLSAAAPAVEVQPAPTPTTFEGWINFSGEEFQLVENQNRYVSGARRPCVSGSLPRDLQRMSAQTIGRQKVRVTGTTMAWSSDLPGNRYEYEGSVLRNECGADFVILGTDISVIQ